MSVKRGDLVRAGDGSGVFTGEVFMFGKPFRFRMVEHNGDGENSPSHKLLHDKAGVEIGAAFTQKPRNGGPNFLNLIFEGPEFFKFGGKIRFAAFEKSSDESEPWMDAGDAYNITWRAPQQQSEQQEAAQ